MGEITASEIPRMKATQTSGWEVAAGISDSVEEIEIDEYTSNIDFEALQDLEDYVQQKCVNQRDTVSFDKLKETDEFQKLLAECGLEGIKFDNYSDFLSKTQEIKIDTINSSTGINKDDYTPSGNTEQYLKDVKSLTDDLEKQIDYYSDVNNILEQNMDSIIDKVDPTDEINRLLSYLSTGSREADKEFYISQINSTNSTNRDLLSIISGLFPEHEANQDYTLGEGLTFHFDESGNLVVTDYDYDKLSAYLKSIQNEFKDENKYTSEIVAQFVNDSNFDATQSIYMQNTQIKNLLEEQKIKTVTDMYMYSIDTETGEMNYNQDYANYFNQDRFKKNHQESYSIYEIYQSMLDQSATLPGFAESFYELANYMDQDQLSVFIYLYGTQGSDAALDYVNLFKNKKTEYEAMREISNELESIINWPDEINEYSDMIYEVSNYISENYDNVTMDWDEFKNREEFQEYIKQLAYYKYTYENPDNELDFDEWQESNQEYINNFVDGVTAFDNSEELISSLLTAETEMTYSYINEIINDPTQVKLKENIETLVLARLGGFGEGLMSGLSLTSNKREQLTQQYTASILSQSMMLNIAYQVGNQEGSMLPSMYLGMIGGYYGGELATQTLGIFNGADSKAIDFINSALNKTVKTVELADETTQTISLGQSLISNSGRAIYGLDMFTNSFYGSKINGSTTGEAIGRAFLDSLIQVGAQAFIGRIPGLSRSGEYLAQDKLDAVRAWLCKSLQEGAANAATIYVTQGINSVLYGDEFDLDSITEEAYTQFIVGAIVGAETNVGQLANYKEKTIKITLNGLSYEVPIEDLYSLIEKNGKVSKEDMVKLVQGLSTSTISISAQAQELKEKYKLTDAEAIDAVNIMANKNVTEEEAAIMTVYKVPLERVSEILNLESKLKSKYEMSGTEIKNEVSKIVKNSTMSKEEAINYLYQTRELVDTTINSTPEVVKTIHELTSEYCPTTKELNDWLIDFREKSQNAWKDSKGKTAWPPDAGNFPGSKIKNVTVKKGTIIDRAGNADYSATGGRFVADSNGMNIEEIKEGFKSGNLKDERAMDPNGNTDFIVQYEVTKDINNEAIQKAFANSDINTQKDCISYMLMNLSADEIENRFSADLKNAIIESGEFENIKALSDFLNDATYEQAKNVTTNLVNRLIKNFDVQESTIDFSTSEGIAAPWFDEAGGAHQYEFVISCYLLEELEFITPIGKTW